MIIFDIKCFSDIFLISFVWFIYRNSISCAVFGDNNYSILINELDFLKSNYTFNFKLIVFNI